jgi:hypothetical protein
MKTLRPLALFLLASACFGLGLDGEKGTGVPLTSAQKYSANGILKRVPMLVFAQRKRPWL